MGLKTAPLLQKHQLNTDIMQVQHNQHNVHFELEDWKEAATCTCTCTANATAKA